jgi:hypothetical protein
MAPASIAAAFGVERVSSRIKRARDLRVYVRARAYAAADEAIEASRRANPADAEVPP